MIAALVAATLAFNESAFASSYSGEIAIGSSDSFFSDRPDLEPDHRYQRNRRERSDDLRVVQQHLHRQLHGSPVEPVRNSSGVGE